MEQGCCEFLNFKNNEGGQKLHFTVLVHPKKLCTHRISRNFEMLRKELLHTDIYILILPMTWSLGFLTFQN